MISKVERCEASPTATVLGRLSGAFGLPLSVLLALAERGGAFSLGLRKAGHRPSLAPPRAVRLAPELTDEIGHRAGHVPTAIAEQGDFGRIGRFQ